MSVLNSELERFFGWCGLTELEYRMGYRPRIAIEIFEGWEESLYPFWEEMDNAFAYILENGDGTNAYEIALALSVDWESSALQDKLLRSTYKWKSEVYAHIITNPAPCALTSFWEALSGPFADLSRDCLPRYITKEHRPHYARIALLLLLEIDQREAIKIAARTVMHPDQTMCLTSLKVLFDHDKEAYIKAEKLIPYSMRMNCRVDRESIGLPEAFWEP